MNCSGVHFTQLPDELPVNVVSLDLSRNLLSEIDLNALTRFTELRELNLSQNQIHRIEKLVSFMICKLQRTTTVANIPSFNKFPISLAEEQRDGATADVD